MRKSLWIITVLVFAAIGAPNAHADSFTVTFTCQAPCGSLPTAPGIVSFPGPTIVVTYDSTVFSLTLSSTPPDTPSDTYDWYAYESGGVPVDFEILDTSTGDDELVGVKSIGPTLSDEGQLTFVATPEPSSLALASTALGVFGLVGLIRRRKTA